MSEDNANKVDQPEEEAGGAQDPAGTETNGNGQAPAGAAEATGELTLEERLAQAELQAAEYLDGWQRARAEFANARRRMEREREDAYRNATADLVVKLLPVIDDFDLAFANVPDEIAGHSWFTGIQLVQRKLQGILGSVKIEPIAAVGQPFDPNYHDAIMKRPDANYASGTIVEELRTGYKLGERVIRPSLVVVAD
ncbi:MAG: nucleotide exchange factor GrpE [Ardenticatenaceae bacterium]|nr:nucleotide exchange factor GrpE [Ardenticatenaceae bacterium]